MLPNFIGVGADKPGFGPLFRLLARHRGVFMPRSNEPHFFTPEWRWKSPASARSFSAAISPAGVATDQPPRRPARTTTVPDR